MELDNLRAAWQDNAFPLPPTEEKKMSQIILMIENNVAEAKAQQRKRFIRATLRMIALPLIVVVLFYIMSDGFTNEADSIGSLMVIVVLFVPLLLFFGSRYYSLRIDTPTGDTRTQLRQTIDLLRRNQRAEVGVTFLLALLAVGGVIAAIVSDRPILWPMLSALILATVVSWRTWRRYKIRLAELEDYSRQLLEM